MLELRQIVKKSSQKEHRFILLYDLVFDKDHNVAINHSQIGITICS